MLVVKLIVNLILLPLYISIFFITAMIGIMIHSLQFFFLGPFAVIPGIVYGTSWAVGCFTTKKKKRRR